MVEDRHGEHPPNPAEDDELCAMFDESSALSVRSFCPRRVSGPGLSRGQQRAARGPAHVKSLRCLLAVGCVAPELSHSMERHLINANDQ